MKNFFKYLLAAFIGCLIALFIGTFMVIGLLGSLGAAFGSAGAAPVVPKSAILKIDFSSQIGEQDSKNPFGTFQMKGVSMGMDSQIGILKAVRAVDEAAKDPAISLIYINADNVLSDMANLEEFRKALLRFKDSGKPVVAYANQYTNASYYIASVADKVVINKYGDFMAMGVTTQLLFLKDILDKAGVKIQLIRHGKYKSAGEMFIANNISEANREQNQVMVSSLWDSWCDDIAASRGFTKEQFNGWLDNLELTDAQSLIDRGVVDEAWFSRELEDYLCTLFNVSQPKELAMVGFDDYAAARVKTDYRTRDKVAVIYANGEIVMGSDQKDIACDRYARIIAKVRADSTVKAVVLRVNSPGGSAQAAEVIRQELARLREDKPLILSFGNYAASGGYWISAGSDKIFTDRTSLTGSIGVFSIFPDVSGTFDKIKVKEVSISSNKHSDMMSMMRPFDAQETGYMQKMVERVYGDFTNVVAEGRGLSVERVDELGQGRVWTGADAIGIGLADEIGGLEDAVRYAATAGNVENYRVIEYPTAQNSMTQMLSQLTGSSVDPDLDDPFTSLARIYTDLTSGAGTICARMDCVYRFN